MAKAELITPPAQQRVVLDISLSEAQDLRVLLGVHLPGSGPLMEVFHALQPITDYVAPSGSPWRGILTVHRNGR